MARVTLRRALALLLVALALAAAVALAGEDDQQGGPPSSPPGLADLWSGRAALVLDRKWTSTELGAPAGGAWAGSHVEIAGGKWYLFNRRSYPGVCAGRDGVSPVGTQVRASDDGGRTWGAPVEILAPQPGTAWACAATDGDAVHRDGSAGWGYLFQCLGDDGGWNGCYARRDGDSPLGAFAAEPAPVLRSGDLWSRICAGDGCAVAPGEHAIGEEGTFDVFAFDGAAWWIGFHGSDGGAHGYRGIARTRTFGDWQVDGAGGTPTGPVLDAGDATGWRETWNAGGPIGVGAGSIVAERGWYYQLAEFADVSLQCTPGQNWDLGLFRTRRLASTAWEQYPGGNPLVYSGRGIADLANRCSVGYPRLFRDPGSGTTYVMHGRRSADPSYDAIYVYRLEWNRNLLANGDFQRADAEGWQPLGDVRRIPEGSPDGTPYLELNCGAPVCEGVYQDVAVAGPALEGGDELAFGGSISGDGRLDVAVHQLDADGRAIETATVRVEAGGAYVRARGELELDDRTRRLRFQLYPRTPGTLRADNLYVIPQDGCSEPRYPAC